MLTLAEARRMVRAVGLVLRKVDGEYRVNFSRGREETAYYTDHIDDAVSTAIDMANRGDSCAKS